MVQAYKVLWMAIEKNKKKKNSDSCVHVNSFMNH